MRVCTFPANGVQGFYRMEPGPAVGVVEYIRMFTDHLIDDTITEDQMPVWQTDHGQIVAALRLFSGHETSPHLALSPYPSSPHPGSRPPSRRGGKPHQRLEPDD